MLLLSDQNVTTLIMDLTAIFLILGILINSGTMRRRGHLDDELFLRLMTVNVIIALSDIPQYVFESRGFAAARYIVGLSTTVFAISMMAFAIFWIKYALVRFRGDTGDRYDKVLYIPGFLLILFIVINIFTGHIMEINDNSVLVVRSGVYMLLFFAAFVVYMVAGFLIIAKNKNAGGEAVVPFYLYLVPLVAAFVIPFITNGVFCIAVCLALTIAFTHFGTVGERVRQEDWEIEHE